MTDHTEKRCRDCDGYNCDNGCAYPPKDTEMQIPDDVMEAARAIFLQYANFPSHHASGPAVSHVINGGLDDMPMIQIAARAILAERERCARIAENYDHGVYAAEAIRGNIE